METRHARNDPRSLRPPLSRLDELVLETLSTSPASGYAVTKLLGDAKGPQDQNLTRATYVALHRLERRGLLISEWRAVPGRRLCAEYYRVSAAGFRKRSACHRRSVRVGAVCPTTTLVALAVVSAGETAQARQSAHRPLLTIAVNNRVAIASISLARATIDVTRVLGAIGVDTVWLLNEIPADSELATSARQRTRDCVVHAVMVGRAPVGASTRHGITLGIAPAAGRAGGAGGADIVLFHEHIEEFSEAA